MQEQNEQEVMKEATARGKAAMGVWRNIRRVFVTIAGVTVILIGIVLLVTPGPAMLVIPVGFAILATEYVWAKRLLKRVKASAVSATSAARGKGEDSCDSNTNENKSWFVCVKDRIKKTWQAAIAPFKSGYIDHDSAEDDDAATQISDKTSDA